ncbi:hypothetical protein V6N13_015286 [Hibiscus sabdariffa]
MTVHPFCLLLGIQSIYLVPSISATSRDGVLMMTFLAWFRIIGSHRMTLLKRLNTLLASLVWNDTIFEYIGTEKRTLMTRLRGIQKVLCTRRSHFLVSLESSLLLELECLLDQEELLWRQKSRSEWITHGDRNINYFHQQAIS